MHQASATEALPWFAVRVRSNFERTVSSLLRHRGFEEMVPSYLVRSQWSDRVKQISRPLFPGYVFCRFGVADRLAVVSTPGVVGIAGYGKRPVPIDQDEIEALRAIDAAGVSAAPCPFYRAGDRVTVEAGPLAGIKGTVIEVKNSLRLIVSITILQRSISAEIDRDSVRPDRLADAVYGQAHALEPNCAGRP